MTAKRAYLSIWLALLIALTCLPYASGSDSRASAPHRSANTRNVAESSPALALLTYLGGSGVDSASHLAIDSLGNIYVAGTTYSKDFPVSLGAFQPSSQGGDSDGYVMKLSPTGKLIYSTYLGGKGTDVIYGLAVDRLGNAYVTGFTNSNNFPTTEGALEGNDYYFTAKLNATGSDLAYSTRGIGGSAIAVDVAGNAYVAGGSRENDIETTRGAFQREFGGGYSDGFVAKLNEKGDRLVYATYLGGGRTEYISAIAIDRDGNAYVAGNFDSYPSPIGPKPFPTTAGAYLEKSPAAYASFVSKLDPTGSALVYSTYIEASTASGIAVDDDGNAYVTGDATVIDATANAFQRTAGGVCCYYFSQSYHGGGDAFVMKLNPSGSALVYSTFLGGSNYDAGYGIAVDTTGSAYVAGYTDSPDFPLANPIQIANRGIVRSDDRGQNWSPANRGLAVGDVRVLVVDPRNSSTLYAGSQLGILKSTDRGDSWTAINNGLTGLDTSRLYGSLGVRSLAIDPANSSMLYAGLDSGLFKSDNAGSNWRFVRSGVAGVAFDPASPTTIYGAAKTVIKSTDGGATWKEMNLALNDEINGVNKVVVAPTSPPTIYAEVFLQTTTAQTVGLIKSTDGGTTWRKVGRGPNGGPFGSDYRNSLPLVIDPGNPSVVYSWRLRSTDSGQTWSELNLPNLPINALAIDQANPFTLFVGAGDYETAGVYKSTDGGASWILTQLHGAQVYSLAVDSNNRPSVYAGTGILSDAFLAKLDPSGSLLAFSTMLGGFAGDSANSVAIDAFGNVYIAGWTTSSELSTINAIQTKYGGSTDGFVAIIGSLRPLSPRISSASINRKTLTVFGESFDFGATILVDGKPQMKTENDHGNPTTTLIAQKSGRNISSGQTVKLQVRNPDGTFSPEFSFTRP